MTINFLKGTFYQYNSTLGDYDSGLVWKQFKKELDDSSAFEINLYGFNQIQLFIFGSKYAKWSVDYNQSYFDSKSNYQK